MMDKIGKIQSHFQSIMEILGLDLTDPSLMGTPRRIAKMYVNEIFSGLDMDNYPRIMCVPNEFDSDEMVVVRGITVHSVCEHHFVPFIGVCHIGYIPKKTVLGLSKFNRIVKYFSRRPQLQERLTSDIHGDLTKVLDTDDIGVVVDASHLCVKIRGIQQDSKTVTSKLSGVFRDNINTRNEFMTLCGISK